MPVTDELTSLDATAQAELVRSGAVQPIELVDAAINRIEQLNPQLNAVITPLFEKACDQAVGTRLPDGPFRGVPILLKDFLCHTAGDPYFEGMRYLRDLQWHEERDTYLAARFHRGRLCLRRQDQPARVGGGSHDRAGRLRGHPQPLGPNPLARRVERGVSGSRNRRLGARSAR